MCSMCASVFIGLTGLWSCLCGSASASHVMDNVESNSVRRFYPFRSIYIVRIRRRRRRRWRRCDAFAMELNKLNINLHQIPWQWMTNSWLSVNINFHISCIQRTVQVRTEQERGPQAMLVTSYIVRQRIEIVIK